jgi:transposase
VEKTIRSYDLDMGDEREQTQTAVRVIEANRAQVRLVPVDLEGLLPQDHQARAVWAFVEGLDLSEFYARIAAREGKAGRPAIDPRILLALWIEATLDGIGSAREIERQCRYHAAYQWICGGVNVNYHTLSDFRSESAELLEGVLTQSVAMLMWQGLVEIRRVAQDGMRVRAAAGASSFRTVPTLEKMTRIARQQVETLANEIDSDPGASKTREEAARKRAAEDRGKRIERALEEMQEAEKRKRSKNGKKKSEPRTSTTDPTARVMKMADGGFRPAYNVHLATDTATHVVVAVEVDNRGTDLHAMMPLAEQVEQRFGVVAQEWLADGGCATLDNINKMSQRGCRVFSPLRERRSGRARNEIRPTDSDAVRMWRERMSTDEGKTIYKQRASTAEWVNARYRAQGLGQFIVRGLKKVLSVALLHAITNNMARGLTLAC